MAMTRRVVACLVLFAAGPAAAGDSLTDYAVLRVGTYLPQSKPSPFGGSYGAGLDMELAVGRAFLPWLVGEIGVGYSQSTSDIHQGYYTSGGVLGVTEQTSSFWMVPATASLKFVLPAGTIEPYAFLGAGVYFTTYEKDPTGTLPTISDSATIFGFHAGAGATWRAGDRVLLGLDGRYAFVQGQFFDQEYSFKGIGLTATVAYRF